MSRLPPEVSAPEPTGRDPLSWLSQAAHIVEIDKIGRGEWTTLYEFSDLGIGTRYYYSGLIPASDVKRALKHSGGELLVGQGIPGFSQGYDKGVERTTYHRFGTSGAEPLVHVRDFHGLKPRQFELSEEFRHYHGLYHDRHNDIYIHINDRGDDTIVAEVRSDRVRVLTRHLRQYIAARQIALAIYFDHRADAAVDVEAAKAALPNREVSTNDRRYSFHVGDIYGRAFSRLIGKKIILPPPVTESGVWPFSTSDHQYADFIISVDEGGKPAVHTSDPDQLANYFGANEEAPHYLTPVWFRREVLAKYYDDPNKYSVEDGYLRCGSLWGVRMDNNLPAHIMVYLGDLGRDLDYEEQLYWKSFNITPGDRRPSETNFRRAFLAEFTNPSAPDLIFRQLYVNFQEAWAHQFGWALFRPPHEGDAHILGQLRVPLSQSVGEFDTQILYLAKLLVDSLNGEKLSEAGGARSKGEKSIAKFERYLEASGYPHSRRDNNFLRLIQRFRSIGSAHKKGADFEQLRKEVGLDQKSHAELFREFLDRANTMLDDLSAHFLAPAGGSAP